MVKEDTVLRTRKIRLYLNQDQKRIFKQWMGTARYTYNQALSYINYKKIYPNFIKVRNAIVPKDKIDDDKQWIINTPKNIRAEAVKDLCNAMITNIKSGKKFKMRFRSKKDNLQSITIGKEDLKEALILYPTILKENKQLIVKEDINYVEFKRKRTITKEINKQNKGSKSNNKKTKNTKKKIKKIITYIYKNQLECDCKIILSKTGKWYLCITESKNIITDNQSGKIASLDPGIRTFQTLYSPNGICESIGENVCQRIVTYGLKIDRLISKCTGLNCKKRYRLKKAINRKRETLRNLVDDLHWKTIKHLFNNYDTIIIPDTKVQGMINKNNRKIGNKSVRSILSLRHYEFRQRLITKAEEYKNKHVIICDEKYTSKTCTNCGNINWKLGGNKIYECNLCKIKIDRDINGARNILFKASQLAC